MSQTDYGTIVATTKTGTQLAADLNAQRDSYMSTHSGSSTPSYAVAGTVWLDTSGTPWVLYMYDGTDNIQICTVNATTNVSNLLNTALSNLGTTAVNADIDPASDITLNLGNYLKRWNDAHIRRVLTGRTDADVAKISAWDGSAYIDILTATCDTGGTPTGNLNREVGISGNPIVNIVAAAGVPGITEDDAAGHIVGSLYLNTSTNTLYVCTDNTTGAAVWAEQANDTLSNLGATAINADLDPASDLTQNLGNYLKRWNDAHIRRMLSGRSAADVMKLAVYDVDGAAYVDAFTLTANNTPTADLNAIVTHNSKTIATLSTPQEWTKTQNFNETAITSTTNSVAWDLESNQTALHTMTENTTLANPTNMLAGATYILRVVQGAGPYTLAFGTAYKWPGGTGPTVSTGSGDIDLYTFYCDGTNMLGTFAQAFA